MADLAITALPTASQLSSSDLLYVAIPNPLSPIGFSLCKMTSVQFGLFLNKDLFFASDLETDSKNIIGAINELKAGGGGGGASVIQLTAAEYAQLTQEEKINGSIYKLTDKAIFYCLDEEYHAVKELTSAQYEALSTAQQNNGTIYIQTDAETTGSDIAVSSSDATSIADKLDSIGTITQENWIATQSSANGTVLTDTLSLNEGTYIIQIKTPNTDNDISLIIRNADTNAELFVTRIESLGDSVCFIHFYDAIRIQAVSAQSATVNFSNLSRGGLKAMKIS